MSQDFDAERAAVAREIKRLYIELKKKATRNRNYKPDKRNDSAEVWGKCADLCIELKASPEDFVSCAFEYCTLSGGPFVTGMTGPSMRRWYQMYQTKAVESGREAKTPSEVELKIRMACLNNFLHRKLGTNDPDNPEVISELTSPIFGLDSLACMLLAGDNDRVMARHGREAREVLSCRPDLVRALREMNYPLAMIFNDNDA